MEEVLGVGFNSYDGVEELGRAGVLQVQHVQLDDEVKQQGVDGDVVAEGKERGGESGEEDDGEHQVLVLERDAGGFFEDADDAQLLRIHGCCGKWLLQGQNPETFLLMQLNEIVIQQRFAFVN